MSIPEPAPAPPIPLRGISDFYVKAASHFKKKGITACITGGQACIRYNLVQFSKDSDWLILKGHPNEVVATIAEMVSPHGTKPRYNIAAGAPFDERWARHGWSSHIFFPDAQENPGARMDLFGRGPRASKPPSEENWPYIDRHTLACVKKTQRDKDWPFVHQIGLQMCKNSDPAGLLHLQDAQTLLVQIEKLRDLTTPDLQKSRPLLQIVAERPDLAEAMILGERELWKKIDHLRISHYLKAWTEYGEEIRRRAECQRGPLEAQHRILTEIASDLLPENPFEPLGEDPGEAIWRLASEHVRKMFPHLPNQWMPTTPPNTFI